ncbi:MAG: SCO family protein [Telluria sp.]|nr:SCO family protein [Telluria sp.]
MDPLRPDRLPVRRAGGAVLADVHRALPAAPWHVFSLHDYRGKLLAIEFIYTRCSTICRTLGMSFKQIRDRIPAHALGRDFALLTISFDTQSDDPARLKAYANAYGADGKDWRVARVPDAAQLT